MTAARRYALPALNIGLHVAHQIHIAFILFGWMFCSTRLLNLIAILLTLFSWYGIGPLLGKGNIWGYCVITDIQWQVRKQLGLYAPQGGYIKYLADRLFDRDFDAEKVDIVGAVVFLLCIVASVGSLIWFGVCPLFA